MSAEKFVKNEAKKMLSGKWPIAVFSVLVLLFVPIIVILLVGAGYSLLGDTDDIAKTLSGSPAAAAVFAVFHLAAVLALILLSPMFNGFARVYSSVADGKRIDPGDLFYFFDNKSRYRSAVKFMTGVIMKSVGIILLCDVAGAGLIAWWGSSVIGNDLILVGGILLTVIGTITAFCIIHRFAFSVMLFSYYDYDADSAVSYGAKIARGNTIKLVKLTGSFVPWLLLTFFVVPFVYVYPYMTCSYFVSVKYIIQQYKEQFGDSDNSYANQSFNMDMGAVNAPQTNSIKTAGSQIPPITEDRSRASHFPQVNNSAFEQAAEKLTSEKTEVKAAQESSGQARAAAEYDLENFAEKKNSVSLDKEEKDEKI